MKQIGEPVNMAIRIYVLNEDVNFFGNNIKKGSVYKQKENNKDYYECNCEEDNMIIIKPAFNLHFTVVENNPLFIKTFSASRFSV